jgi:hypothetical protein
VFIPIKSHLFGNLLPAALLGAALAAGALQAQIPEQGQPGQASLAPTDVVLTVGDRKITVEEFEKITAALPPQFAGAMAQLGKRGFADQYSNLLALALEGEKLKVDQQEPFRQMLEFQRMILLAQSAVTELAGPQVPVSSSEVQAQYDAHQGELQEVHLRGIYVPFDPEPGEVGDQPAPEPVNPGAEKVTEAAAREKAESIRTRITGGADLAEMAKTESEHPTSSSGGDFGFVRRGQFAPEIDSAIFGLQPSEITQPLRDRFGFFIFRLEEKRTAPLEQVRQMIENSLRQERLMGLFARMKAEYPVTLDSRYFPEAPAAPPMPFPPQ